MKSVAKIVTECGQNCDRIYCTSNMIKFYSFASIFLLLTTNGIVILDSTIIKFKRKINFDSKQPAPLQVPET